MRKTLSLRFGAMSDPIHHQLDRQGFEVVAKDVKHWQKCADAITLLSIHAYLSDSEKERARKRLGAAIGRTVVPKGGSNAT